ncbi:hypothetical protein E1B28_007505 [Marasmius oreades]|uniref:VHS domain-containing protein n=1 Tax=Marasmius oreades TaxID=181124 RepID=A0A9P7S1Z9_9AGAR|nr:uncharacterized protein E1B28_007505 [Marasmius oreades]KAG7093867.1 hypothetical protein E1B28_007505 [Marasmius oreades]
MSALNFARQVFNPEKPHSSITDWVDILTVSSIEEEAYDGIPELVESINLQGTTGPAEASRALRKKLKHGNPHQQYRSLVLLKALVENCDDRFHHTFADNQLIDAFRAIAADRNADKRVQKKLKLVLLSWQEQFKSEPSMRHVADLYLIIKDSRRELENALYVPPSKAETGDPKKKKEEAREKERERLRSEEDERKRKKAKTRRQPFNFEQEKPKVLASIAEASQASSNLVNAIILVNPEKESLLTNERVQDCLEIAKQARKAIVRYVQLVENEEVIGVLIETNDRIITALEMYDQAQAALQDKADTKDITSGLAGTRLGGSTGELTRLQDRQRAEVEKAKQTHTPPFEAHPDLQDLDFGASSSKLPPPLRPMNMGDRDDEQGVPGGGSLSDFSDYESSDEDMHNNRAWSRYENKQEYITVSDDSDDAKIGIRRRVEEENPFADPFADQVVVGPSKHL